MLYLLGVGKKWRDIFSEIVHKVKGPEATMACQDDQLCAGIKAGIDDAFPWGSSSMGQKLVYGVMGFLLINAKNAFNEINLVEMLWRVQHLWPSVARFLFN